MTDRKSRLQQLHVLSQLILNSRLSALRAADLARRSSLDRLADLASPAPPIGLPDVAAHDVRLRYECWADQKRSEINLTLARQTAEWLDARADAAIAFGRSKALSDLTRRIK